MNFGIQWNIISFLLVVFLIAFSIYWFFYFLLPELKIKKSLKNKINRINSYSIFFFSVFFILFFMMALDFQIKGSYQSSQKIHLRLVIDDSLSIENKFEQLKTDIIEFKKSLSKSISPSLELFSGKNVSFYLKQESSGKYAFAFSHFTSTGEIKKGGQQKKNDLTFVLSDCLFAFSTKSDLKNILQTYYLCYQQKAKSRNIALSYIEEKNPFFAGFTSRIKIEAISTYVGAARLNVSFKNKKHSTINKNIFLKQGTNEIELPLKFASSGNYAAVLTISANEQISESRILDNSLVYSFLVSPGKKKLILASSIPGYDFSLWRQVGLSSGAFVLEKRVALLKKDELSFSKNKSDILLVHNIALPQWKASLKQASLFIAGPDTKISLKKTFPSISFYKGVYSLSDDSLLITDLGKSLGFIPNSIQGESISLKNLIAISEDSSIDVLIRSKKYNLPVFVRMKKTGQLILLTDSLYKNYFIGLGLKNQKTSIKHFYGSLLEYISREKDQEHWKLFKSYLTLAKPALFQIPVKYGKSKVFFKSENDWANTLINKDNTNGKKSSFEQLKYFQSLSDGSTSLSKQSCLLAFQAPSAGAYVATIKPVSSVAGSSIPFYVNYSRKELKSFYDYSDSSEWTKRNDIFILPHKEENTKSSFLQTQKKKINKIIKDFQSNLKQSPEMQREDYVLSFRTNPYIILTSILFLLLFWYAALFPTHLLNFYKKK